MISRKTITSLIMNRLIISYTLLQLRDKDQVIAEDFMMAAILVKINILPLSIVEKHFLTKGAPKELVREVIENLEHSLAELPDFSQTEVDYEAF